MEKIISSPVRYLKGIGPQRAKNLKGAGINTIEDILYYFPRRYEDRTAFVRIAELREGDTKTIKAEILAKGIHQSFRKRGFNITEIVVGDDSGKIFCVWFNQVYLKNYFKVGQAVILYGKVERYGKRLQINSPEFEIVSQEDTSLSIGRIVPIYALPEGISQRYLRRIIKTALDEYLPRIIDFLPYDIRSRNSLLNLAKAILDIHFPDSLESQKEAFERLSFDEFFIFQLPLALRKLEKRKKAGIAHKVEGKLINDFIDGLPFKLTPSQKNVLNEITSDMAILQPMQRLLQGDVGSGKTVVATIAALIAMQGGYQAAFMVPTEILAKQHYEKIKNQIKDKRIHIGLLTGSVDTKARGGIYQDIREGKIDLLIGTHALLECDVEFKNLGLVVIDEQHKFGVGQRALLPAKAHNPDVLIMTATPIPRTLAITLYGDLDISIINELPPGRLPIKTVHFSEEDKTQAYKLVKDHLRQRNQAYIVYPVIEESYALDIAGAKKMYEDFRAGEFREFRLGLIHGRMKQQDQDEIMHKFKNREIDALVSTTVLEVGIDIPNATCMLVEHAQRFGLSQLHQLRGRIGRGSIESTCILISAASTTEAKRRIGAMLKYTDGFRIAEEDLKIRGPGEFFGRRQHGLTELRIANPLTQMQLLKRARDEAIRLINIDSQLKEKQDILLKEKLLQRFPEYEKLVVVG